MTDKTQQSEAPDLELMPVTRGEKIAGWVGLAVLAALAVICFDLATGGKYITSRLPAAARTAPEGIVGGGPDDEPCDGCP